MTGTSEKGGETPVSSENSRGTSRDRTDLIGVATLGVLFALAATAIQAHRLARFEVRSFDLAIFAQGLWSLAHGHGRSSIQGTSFLAVHFSPLLFALAPLARLAGAATPLLLVLAQGLALGAMAPLAYALARPAGRGAAVALGVAALAHPGVRALALDGFHDVCLGAPLALLLALAIERAWSARRLLAVALATALLADEVFPLVLPGAALWLLVERRRREAASVLALGAAVFALVNFVVLGWLRGGALHVESLYDHLRDPRAALAFLAGGALVETVLFAVALLGPLAFLPLARPSRLAPGALVFALCAASRRPAQRSIAEHYHAPIAPFVLAAAAAALVGLERRWPGRGARIGAASLLGATLVANVVVRAEVRADLRDLASSGATDPRGALVERITPGSSVLASVDFLHALVARDELLGLPGALRGTKDWSSVPYELPARLDFVLADTMDTASWSPELERPDARHVYQAAAAQAGYARRWDAIALDGGLGVIAIEGSTVLLGRGGSPLVEAIAPLSTISRAISEDPHVPRLVAVEEGALVWAAPERWPMRQLYLETDDGRIRPLLWRLHRSRPWPEGKQLREHVAPGSRRIVAVH